MAEFSEFKDGELIIKPTPEEQEVGEVYPFVLRINNQANRSFSKLYTIKITEPDYEEPDPKQQATKTDQ